MWLVVLENIQIHKTSTKICREIKHKESRIELCGTTHGKGKQKKSSTGNAERNKKEVEGKFLEARGNDGFKERAFDNVGFC